jgi:hypothetical protein
MIEEEAQLVFNILKTPQNKYQLRDIMRNLFSLLRRCKDNKDLTTHMLENFYLLEKEIQSYQKINGTKNRSIFNRFKMHFETLVQPCIFNSLPKSRQLKKLSGPSSFVYFNHKNLENRRILILGEFHQLTRICKKENEVQDWLWDLSHDAPECLDLFNEYWPSSDTGFKIDLTTFKNSNSPLDAVINQFEDCKDKKCSNKLRYHHTDIRESNSTALIDLALTSYDNRVKTQNNYNLTSVLMYYLGFGSLKNNAIFEKETKDFIHELYKMSYHENLAHEKWHSIQQDISSIRNHIKKQSRKSILFIPKIKQILKRIKMDDLLDIVNKGMDIFLLLRLFSKFDSSKMERGPLYCKKTQYPKNIIIYCGDAHQEFYTFFMKEYFDITPDLYIYASNLENPNQCLTFNPPFDFFENLQVTRDVIEI